jgi:hypothetical protein
MRPPPGRPPLPQRSCRPGIPAAAEAVAVASALGVSRNPDRSRMHPASGFFGPRSRRTVASRSMASAYGRRSSAKLAQVRTTLRRGWKLKRVEVETGVEGVGHRIGRACSWTRRGHRHLDTLRSPPCPAVRDHPLGRSQRPSANLLRLPPSRAICWINGGSDRSARLFAVPEGPPL